MELGTSLAGDPEFSSGKTYHSRRNMFITAISDPDRVLFLKVSFRTSKYDY